MKDQNGSEVFRGSSVERDLATDIPHEKSRSGCAFSEAFNMKNGSEVFRGSSATRDLAKNIIRLERDPENKSLINVTHEKSRSGVFFESFTVEFGNGVFFEPFTVEFGR